MSEARFVEVFRRAALQAGAVARRLQGEVRAREKQADLPEAAAISAVDLATQDVLLLPLHEAFPDAAVDAEEDTETARRFLPEAPDRPLIVVDPIDGTWNYLNGSDEYAVMGAWLEGGEYRAAVAYYPAWGVTYWARRGAGCFRQPDGGAPERVTAARGLPARVLVGPRMPQDAVARLEAAGHATRLSRCTAVEAAAPALGRAAAAVHWGAPDRRGLLTLLLTLEAGGVAVFERGPWRGEDPAGGEWGTHVVARDPDLARRLLSAAEG